MLKRQDREAAYAVLSSRGWAAEELAERIGEHINELSSLSAAERTEMEASVNAALTLPGEKKKTLGLIKIMTDEGLDALLRACKSEDQA